jgi:SpoVK/Ycf46/Vps4 family AAA+-type ATPase
MGRLYNRLQGESERALRSVIKTADAFGRCVLFLDEIDKMAGGAHSSAQTDGGTTLRLIGRLLSWMSDRPDNGPFIFATCNDYSSLAAISDGALVRAGRWDGTLFFDLPTAREAVQILGYYAKQYDLDMNQRIPDLAEWSGAEIKQLCRISKMMNLPLVEAMDYVTIQAKVHGKRFQELREWARTRCVQASLDESPQVKQSKKKLALAVDRQ